MIVLGVDPSLTATALCTARALPGPTWDLEFETSKTKPVDGGAAAKHDRMLRQATRVARAAARADLTLIEGLSFNSKGNATRDAAGLWWLVLDRLTHLGRPLAVVPPGLLKKWITGKGTADKFVVGQAIGKRWPDHHIGSHDEADALTLASMGLHALDLLPWQPTAYQGDALTRMEWIKWVGERP